MKQYAGGKLARVDNQRTVAATSETTAKEHITTTIYCFKVT
jgi:hypothetical protein